MRYYSTMRPFGPGTFPQKDGRETIVNFNGPTYCEEIGREAWGYIDYPEPLTKEEAEEYELTKAGEATWYSVTVASKKHGGGLKAIVENDTVETAQRPQDERWETGAREFKRRYFKSLAEAERVRDVLNTIEVTTERVRSSVTQGECKAYINGTYILNFGDDIVIIPKEADPADYYGENIGGFASKLPDSSMTLGLIWHPYDDIYHYDKLICSKLGIEPEEWIGGNNNE